MSDKKIAVILSGCGFKDGSAITEAVSVLIAISQSGSQYQCFAPDIDAKMTNHKDDSPQPDRNLLVESARIARGDISPLSDLDSSQFDGLVFPGGFGVALHLCDWASAGHKGKVLEPVQKIIKSFSDSQKPIGGVCIAPALLALVLGKEQITLTLGNDKENTQELEKTGAQHEDCAVDDFITDREHRIITTPAYMYGDAKPHEVFKGISGLVRELVEMA